ncbi:hypothetical protein CFC21_027509 [Triticum aestivum]|uniref:Amine oxidase domain-containing protein n=3 Tax=Triticum aestivum TaxID=4565 RepID=A0A9R1ENV4_WHEAT|nr:uncharacterized protein LOC123051189 isoform X1 [Triticum aestivum]KAF7013425.1 hypothetical protein CFC21_027509 [Triticum aestivum]
MRVAVVGGGVSGLTAAQELAASGGARVTVYEKEDWLGGGARTVAFGDGPGLVRLDLCPMVFKQATCPNMMQWLELLGVEIERSELSFSVSTKLDNGRQCEWSTSNGISSLFAQKSNALRPSFWCTIREILKFKSDVLRYLEYHENSHHLGRNETLGQFVQSHEYSSLFQESYLIPICTSIWSCPSQGVLGFSAFSVLSFFRNHDLFQLFGRPESFAVKGHLQSFVDKVRVELESMGCRIKTSCAVKSVLCHDTAGYRVQEGDGSEEIYDKVVLAIHPPAALKILGTEATHEELRILGAFQYVYSDIYLHCDKSLMPQNLSAWSAWNFLGETSRVVFVTYWLNLIQNIECAKPFLVTINPPRVPDHVLLKWCASHLVPSMASVKASIQLDQIQGTRGIWFSDAYQGHGFHEQGLKAGKAAAQGVLGKEVDHVVNPKQMVPSWTEAGARLLVARFLNRSISIGNLILLEDGGSMLSFGDASGKQHVKSVLRVHDPMFYWKVATESDLGLADAYINGWCSFVDKKEGLLNLFLIFIANRDAPNSSSSVVSKRGWWTPMLLTAGLASAKYFLRHTSRKNSVTQTRRNISQHYDLSNDFFSLFLDKTMTYSCGIFKREDESLEASQIRKLNLLIYKAKVERDHHVLEIGSGWGGLAIQVVKQTGCKYTGITLSEEQLKYAQGKVKEAGLEDHITFLLCDYRQIPARKYDRIISCEMIEHVGHEYLDAFFTCCESHLAQDGIFVLQAITMPDELYEEYIRSPGFIKEYIFPGGSLPSLSRITSVSASARLCIEHLENINGDQYYLTLRSWRDNLMANKDEILALGFDDKFIRVWEYYFIYCAAGFRTRILGDYQVVFSRPGNNKLALD